jgi:hypothetical protein
MVPNKAFDQADYCTSRSDFSAFKGELEKGCGAISIQVMMMISRDLGKQGLRRWALRQK